MFTLIVLIIHLLPPGVLNAMGAVSDTISDMSPEIVRMVEHVTFTLLLN